MDEQERLRVALLEIKKKVNLTAYTSELTFSLKVSIGQAP